MTTIKNIARPCGDCWTDIREESVLYRAGTYFGRMYEVTGNLKYETIGYWCDRAAQVDICTILVYITLALALVSVGALIDLSAANGYDMIDTIKTFFRTLVRAYTHSQRVLVKGPETANYLYVIGLF